MDWNIIAVLISISAGICGMVIGIAGTSRNRRQDNRSEAAQLAQITAQVGSIDSGVVDLKRQIERLNEKQEKQHVETMTRLAAVEASAKQAHKRIDGIEGKTND